MDRNSTTATVAVAITVFTLFAVTAARISDSSRVHNCGINSLPESVILPSETVKSRSDTADHVKKSETDRMFRVDLTPRSDFARFHAINRRFFDEHRPYRRSEISHRNDVVLTRSDARNHRRGVSSRFMKFKHEYEHEQHQNQHHRHQHHKHHHIRHNMKDVSVPKHKFVSEKMKRLVQEHKEKEETRLREHEVSFMKSIRKFLKHSFD